MMNISDSEFENLSTYIKNNYGINLSEKKKALVVGRLQNILVENNFESFSQYYDYVISDTKGVAITDLVNKITTNHTYFMREPTHFSFFKKEVLPFWEKMLKNTKDLRIWSAGCSTGEEPYTLAMIIADYFEEEKSLWDTRILATDISMRVIRKAKAAIYSDEQVDAISKIWRLKYFQKIDEDSWIIKDNIKKEVILRIFNLMNKTFPFKKKFHVIFCRNVMIYFDNETKNNLINKFYEYIESGGYLFIGHSESINKESTKFKYIMPAVYRKE